ncbi:hypothetical protein Tco_1534215 [Tanacetum coccineum]
MEQPMSPIHTFLIKDMYTLEFSDSFQHTGSFQELVCEDFPVEVAAPPPKTKSKPTRGRQKRTVQREDAPRHVAWINAEEIALCKGWVYVFENSRVGNTRKGAGFWTEFCNTWRVKHSSIVCEHTLCLKLMQSELPKFVSKSRKGNSKRYKTSKSSSFNIEPEESSISLNVDVGDDEDDEV